MHRIVNADKMQSNMIAKIGQRLPALDLTRVIAMIMMIQGHVIFALGASVEFNKASAWWMLWEFFRGMTAPIFLMVSGASHVFANKRNEKGKLDRKTIKKRIRTCLTLFAIGYILVFPAGNIYDLLFLNKDTWRLFFQVNILQLFGVTLLILLGLYSLTKTDKALGNISLVIALVITFITPFWHMINWFNIFPEFIAAYLSNKHGSLFPIVPYGSFLFYGVAIGVKLKSMPYENRSDFLLKKSYLIGMGILTFALPIYYFFDLLNLFDKSIWWGNPGFILIRVGIVLGVFSLSSVIYSKTKQLAPQYSLFAKRAIFIYVIHLLILYGARVFPGLEYFYGGQLSLFNSGYAAFMTILATLGIVYTFDYSVRNYAKFSEFYRYIVTAYLIYLFFI